MTTTQKNSYVRSQLVATLNGIPEASIEVECWLDDLEDVLEMILEPCPACSATGGYCGGTSGHHNCGVAEGEVGGNAQDAYDLLASVAKLERVKPELVTECGGVEILQRAEKLLQVHGAKLARRAIGVLNPTAWLQDVAGLETWLDELQGEEAEIRKAVELLEDLDDAELVLAMAHRHGVEEKTLEEEVDACVAWMCQNASLFLAASVWVQAVGQGLRPGLEDEDYGLACTALKFVQFLDEAEAAEADLTLANVKPLPVEVAKGIIAEYLRQK